MAGEAGGAGAQAAKTLAKCMDYPWDHMPEQGRQAMRKHAQEIVSEAVAAERERAALVCDDEARIRTDAGNAWPEESPERSRCYAAARAAINCAKGVRNGELVTPNV